jgi:hypothetical protein
MSADQIDPAGLYTVRLDDEIGAMMTAVSLSRTTEEALAIVLMVRAAVEALQRVENAALAKANLLPAAGTRRAVN